MLWVQGFHPENVRRTASAESNNSILSSLGQYVMNDYQHLWKEIMRTKRFAINSKSLISTPCEHLMRIMQSSDKLATIYTERFRYYGKVPGAIVFAEQLFGLKEKRLFAVDMVARRHYTTFEFGLLEDFILCPYNTHIKITTMCQLKEHENTNSPLYIYNGDCTYSVSFDETVGLFTSKRHAMNWMRAIVNTDF